jgi:hypothetical protein
MLTSSHLHRPVIRIGGNSAEDSCYIPNASTAPASPHCTQNITAADLAAYARFAAVAPNVSYVIDTNLMQGDPSVGAAHIEGLTEAGLWLVASFVHVSSSHSMYGRSSLVVAASTGVLTQTA